MRKFPGYIGSLLFTFVCCEMCFNQWPSCRDLISDVQLSLLSYYHPLGLRLLAYLGSGYWANQFQSTSLPRFGLLTYPDSDHRPTHLIEVCVGYPLISTLKMLVQPQHPLTPASILEMEEAEEKAYPVAVQAAVQCGGSYCWQKNQLPATTLGKMLRSDNKQVLRWLFSLTVQRGLPQKKKKKKKFAYPCSGY